MQAGAPEGQGLVAGDSQAPGIWASGPWETLGGPISPDTTGSGPWMLEGLVPHSCSWEPEGCSSPMPRQSGQGALGRGHGSPQ